MTSTVSVEKDSTCSVSRRFPRREDVEHSNRAKIGGINDVEMQIYYAADGGTLCRTDQGSRLLSNFMAPGEITLKIGAQVNGLFFRLNTLFLNIHPGDVDQEHRRYTCEREYGNGCTICRTGPR